MRIKIRLYIVSMILLMCNNLAAQDVQEIKSNFEEHFKGDDRTNMKFLRDYLDDKNAARQQVLDDIDDLNEKIKDMNLDTNMTSLVKNTIESIIKSNPDKEIYSATELRPEIKAMVIKFGKGGYRSEDLKDSSITFNIKDVLSDIEMAERLNKTYVNALNVLNKNLRVITSDRQKAQVLVQNIYSVEKGNQDFKTKVSLMFSGIIVVLLIIFFLFIYLKSEHGVANEFLSGNGIQFVALFSLIIAIVLFGILGILEGRELAAILSGISGFILGKGITTKPEERRTTQKPKPEIPTPAREEPKTE